VRQKEAETKRAKRQAREAETQIQEEREDRRLQDTQVGVGEPDKRKPRPEEPSDRLKFFTG
jgi:hypothetical protein